MAAMGQGQASGGGEGAAQATQGQGEGQGNAGPDLNTLASTLGQQGQTLEEMRQFLASNPWAQQQAAEQGQQQEGGGEIDLSFLDEAMAFDSQAASQRLNEVINGAVDQRAQALMQPVIAQQREMRINQEAQQLASEFPELTDPEAAKRLAGQGGLAEQAAQQIAQAIGQPNMAAQLAAEPAVWRMAYMMDKAAQAANNEGSGDPGAAHLESGSGAGPGLTPADLVGQIVNPPSGQLGSRVLDGI